MKKKLKVIDYVFKNFDIKKFHKIIDTYKEDRVDEFCNLVLKCVEEYNPKYVRTNDEHEDDEQIFLEYLGELLKTGEFFLKFKKDFKIEKYFFSIVVEETLWTTAYILFSKSEKKYRLILIHYGRHPGQDSITLMSTKNKFNLNETLNELNNYNQKYHDMDKENPQGEYNLNAPDFKVHKPFELFDTFNVAKNLEYGGLSFGMKKKGNQSTMNKIASGLIGGTILFLILNFIVKPLIEEKKVNKESISEKCGKINLSEKTEKNFLSDLCKKMDTDSQKQSQKKIIEMLKKGSK